MGSDSETEKSAKEKMKFMGLAPIAKPLAGEKLSKKTLKLVRRGEGAEMTPQSKAVSESTIISTAAFEGSETEVTPARKPAKRKMKRIHKLSEIPISKLPKGSSTPSTTSAPRTTSSDAMTAISSSYAPSSSAIVLSTSVAGISSSMVEASPAAVTTDASMMAPSSTSTDPVLISAVAPTEVATTGPSTKYLHERVLAKLQTVVPSRVQAIRPPITKLGAFGMDRLEVMKGPVVTMLNMLLYSGSPPTFEEFVEHVNMLTGMLHSCGLQDCEAWLEYLRGIGQNLLYLEEAFAIRNEGDVTEEAKTLKAMSTKAKAKKSKLKTLSSKMKETVATRSARESALQSKNNSLEIMRKTIADLEEQCRELEADLVSIKEQELVEAAEVATQTSLYAQLKKEGKLLRDQIALRDAAEKELEEQCQGMLQLIKDRPNPLL